MAKETLHIYTRVSTSAQEDQGTSLESQQKLGIKKAKELGFNNKVWNEGGASSNYEDFHNRPILLSLLKKIEDGEVNNLWVYNNDRLSRNGLTAQTIRVALQKNGVTLYTNSGKFDFTNHEDKLLKTLLDGIAEYDNAMRAERTRIGKLNRVKQGFWHGGPPPFGYQIIDKKLALHPEQGKWVKRIFEWYANGKSIQDIRSELMKAGVETNRGKLSWTTGSINNILKNTHPIGEYLFMDSLTNETVECSCPKIVSKTLWKQCQDKRKETNLRKGQKNRTKRFYMLRDLMFCGHCGSHMSGRIKESKNEYLYYCPKKEKDWKHNPPKEHEKWVRGRGCDMVRSLNIKATDNLVWNNVFINVWKSKEFHTALQERFGHKDLKGQDKDIELKKLENEKKRHQKELKNLKDNIIQIETDKAIGKLDPEIADGVLKNFYSMRDETKAKIEQCEAKAEQFKNTFDVFKDSIPVPASDKNKFVFTLDKEPKDKKAMLERYVRRIDVFYDNELGEHTLKIHFSVPLTKAVIDSSESKPANDMTVTLKKTAGKLMMHDTPKLNKTATVE